MSRGGVRGAAVAILLVVGFGAQTAGAQTVLPPELSEYVVLGLEGVRIGRESRILSGAVGTITGTVRVGAQARVSNAVAGPTIRLGLAARTGTLFCHLVSGPPTLPTCHAFADPLLDPALLVPVPVVAGSDDLRIRAHTGTAPWPAGS